MKKIKKELKNIISKIELIIESREACFNNRCNKWQESEKGELFDVKTSEISDVIIDIKGAIDCIDNFLE